jgi:hypothetical protein
VLRGLMDIEIHAFFVEGPAVITANEALIALVILYFG